MLEVRNGTSKVMVELAVGKTPITKGNLTLSTWYALGDKPPKTPYRGRFINPPRSLPENEAATEADTVSYAVPPETAIYSIENFRSVTVSNTYVSVDTTLWAGVLVAVSTALLASYILLKTNPRLKKRHEEPAAT
jgi:hypothetical protein